MMDFEKLGAFYLGKRFDVEADALTDDLLLYDSKDLTTHAVIIGMTGSGKTGLGIGLLEEAAIDKTPVIAIDPKGDMGNIMLAFPDFAPERFLPWVNARQASDQGFTAEQYSVKQASLWKKGLSDWGQDGKRVARLKESADVAIYTPGSNAGLPVSVLQSFAAPSEELIDDIDAYRDRIESTATGILSLLQIDADPITSREHILLANILDRTWREGRSLDIASLINEIQNPLFERVGVMDLNSFFPSKDRFALAMRLNNLLAAPGFDAWLQGEPLNAASLFYSEAGKPRISVMSIAHLDDSQRMFFVCMLLNEIIAWMRAQPGTSSLRAILYMDEIMGYLPPTANPPSKKLFLTLLKQARAYGLGLVLATQNPVDLDYKGLSNTGTWFIGRLQTERDKARVMEGLEGAAKGGKFDKQAMERTLAGLGKRRFLLHNVHEDEAVVFGTRWVMSYLAGPMTRGQIKSLMAPLKSAAPAAAAPAQREAADSNTVAPVLPPAIQQYFGNSGGDNITYYPRLVAAAELRYANARYGVDELRDSLFTVEFSDGSVTVDWDNAEKHTQNADALNTSGDDGAGYSECPSAAASAKNYAKWEKAFKRWVRENETVVLYRNKRYRQTSEPGESEGEFRVRLQSIANEKRDQAVSKLRKRYATKATTLENRLLRAVQTLEREEQQSTKKKLDTAISFGTAILGSLLGRKRISSSTAGRMGTAIRSAGGASKEAGDVKRAGQTVKKVRNDLQQLEKTLSDEIDALDTAFDAQEEELAEVTVRAKTTDVHVSLFGLAWIPYSDSGDKRLDISWNG